MLAAHPPGSGTGSAIRGRVSLLALRNMFQRVDVVSLALPSEESFAEDGVRLIRRPDPPSVATRVFALAYGGALYTPERATGLVARVENDIRSGALLPEYDLVWSYSSLMARAGCVASARARVLDIDNVAWADAMQGAQSGSASLGQRTYRRLSVPALAREERRRCDLYDCVLVTSAVERERLGKIRPPVGVLPNTVPDPGDQIRVKSTARCLLFVGALDYEPNVDAVVWLADEIVPRLRSLVSDATVTVAGRNPGAIVRKACERAQIRLAADVVSLTPLYRDARVVIAPLRLGGGVGRIKVLEGMAYGAAIVGTARALGGLDLESGREVLVADTAIGLADACAGLLNDVDAASRLGANARAMWQAKHTPEAAEQIIREVVDRALAARA